MFPQRHSRGYSKNQEMRYSTLDQSKCVRTSRGPKKLGYTETLSESLVKNHHRQQRKISSSGLKLWVCQHFRSLSNIEFLHFVLSISTPNIQSKDCNYTLMNLTMPIFPKKSAVLLRASPCITRPHRWLYFDQSSLNGGRISIRKVSNDAKI